MARADACMPLGTSMRVTGKKIYDMGREAASMLQGTSNWKDDKRHGQGTCLFADGTRFRGEWEEDAWLQSAAEPALTRVSGPGLTKALAGQTASFVIQAYDELKNKRLSGGDNFLAHLVGPAGVITHASLEDKENGTYLVTYRCTTAGMHDLHITIGGEEHVAESPYSVRLLPVQPVPRKCTVIGPGRIHSTTGELAEFFIEGRDQFGNRCDGDLESQMPIMVELSCKPFTCAVSIIPTDDGRYSCTYTPDRSGFYRLEVTSRRIHVFGSPFSVKVSCPHVFACLVCTSCPALPLFLLVFFSLVALLLPHACGCLFAYRNTQSLLNSAWARCWSGRILWRVKAVLTKTKGLLRTALYASYTSLYA
ncbi:TPA: hypothetical protein ACH3X1_000926 [Trebouxia sp. C0004]